MNLALKVKANPVCLLEREFEANSSAYTLKYKSRDPSFNLKTEFQTIIGVLTYLCYTNRLDIVFLTHQFGRWANDPK